MLKQLIFTVCRYLLFTFTELCANATENLLRRVYPEITPHRTKLKLDKAEKSQYSFKVLHSSKEVPPLIRFVTISSAWDLDPLDPQHFNFLEPDSQNYTDPKFEINQYQQK